MSLLQGFMEIQAHRSSDVHLETLLEEGLLFKIHRTAILLLQRTKVVRARSLGNISLTRPPGAHSGRMKAVLEINLMPEPLFLLQVKQELLLSVEVISSTFLR